MIVSLIRKIACLGVALALASGCYNTKMMEITYAELDTLKQTQRALLVQLDSLNRMYEAEREMRLQTRAMNSAMLDELRREIETLNYRIDDTSQRTVVPVPIPIVVTRNDTSGSTVADTLGPWSPDSGTVATIRAGDSDADKLFKGSYMDLTLGNYDLATQGFKNYLVRNPTSPNLPNAHYYLGESYYSMSRYLEAVAEYQNVIRVFPGSRFAPASYLKAGFCYQRLEESRLAEKSFRDLLARHPRTEEAQQAQLALDGMGG